MRAPFGEPEWRIWACSPGNMGVLPRVDAWFEMHVPAGSETRPDDYIEYIAALPCRVYLRDGEMLRRFGLPYPDQMVKRRFGPYFFTSSIAYLMAYAITLEPDAIGLWGVHMASHEEYAYQRAGCQYFVQRAHECGVAVTVPPASRLLEPPEDRW